MQTFLDTIMEKNNILRYVYLSCQEGFPHVYPLPLLKKYSLIDAIIPRDNWLRSLVGFPPRTVAMVFQGPKFKNKTKKLFKDDLHEEYFY